MASSTRSWPTTAAEPPPLGSVAAAADTWPRRGTPPRGSANTARTMWALAGDAMRVYSRWILKVYNDIMVAAYNY